MDDTERTPYQRAVDRLLATPDEQLSIEDLRERWKFQSPEANLVLPGLAALVYAVLLLCQGEWRNGLLMIGGVVIITVLINAWQNYRAKRMTREQLLESIKIRREIHQDNFDI